jgi:hypothetical protein
VALYTDGTSQSLVELRDGDPLPLARPPQGGFVSYVGIRARNLDGCGGSLTGQLLDLVSGNELAFDKRTVDLVPTGDGWGVPDAKQNGEFANVPGCPDYGPVDVRDRMVALRVRYVDTRKRTATVMLPVVPFCPANANEPLCRCECAANYSLGKCSNVDDGGGP